MEIITVQEGEVIKEEEGEPKTQMEIYWDGADRR